MGTAGPIALARSLLDDGSHEPFYVLNSDVICDFPLHELLEHHRSTNAEATILLTRVKDPSKYGVVVTDPDGKVDAFVEKPKKFVSDRINAGIYCLSIDILKRIQLRPTSIEREIFPSIAADGKLYSMLLSGYWMDVGQPNDYLTGLHLYLNSLRIHRSNQLSSGPNVIGNVMIDSTTSIGEDCQLGPDVCIGKGCVIGNGVRLKNCVVMDDVKIEDYVFCSGSILGWQSKIGKWTRIENGTIFGKDVVVQKELHVLGGVILPHKEIKESVHEAKIIL